MSEFAAIQGIVIRVKRLDAQGNPTGDESSPCGFTRAQSAVRTQAGTETIVRNAGRWHLLPEEDPGPGDRHRHHHRLLQGQPGAVRHRVDDDAGRGLRRRDRRFPAGHEAQERATSRWRSGPRSCPTCRARRRTCYSLFPKVAVGMVGGTITWEDGPQTWTLTAPAEGNPNWGAGTDTSLTLLARLASCPTRTRTPSVLCDPVRAGQLLLLADRPTGVRADPDPQDGTPDGSRQSASCPATAGRQLDDKTDRLRHARRRRRATDGTNSAAVRHGRRSPARVPRRSSADRSVTTVPLLADATFGNGNFGRHGDQDQPGHVDDRRR